MKKLPKSFEHLFTICALLFFTRSLDAESLFSASEGEEGVILTYNPFSPLLSLMQHGIFLITLFLLFERWKMTIRTVLRGRFVWGLVILILLSFLWSDFPDLTQRRSIAFLETTVFSIYLASRYPLPDQLQLITRALGIALLLNLLFTLAVPGSGIEYGIHAGAWRGLLIQKNLLARLMILGFIVFLVTTPKNKRQFYLKKIFLFLFVALVLLSTSKTALMLLILLFMLYSLYKALRWYSLRAIPFFLSGILTIGCVITFVVSNAERLVSAAGRDLTLSGRTVIWSALFDKIQERPWLGFGYMGFWHGVYGESAYVGKVYGTTYIPPHSHNGFIELVLGFGFVGALLFGLSFLSVVRKSFILIRITETSEGLWPLLYLSFLILYNQTEMTLIEHNSIFWVLYVALALSRFSYFNKEKIEPSYGAHSKPLLLP
ncbi:O-antigen ligase [Lyngbya sp. PCC 8106]|uniref:O-antigen ligase family protein n=1 Tax=Lyngbya sp. (strain PCC 8106) TaxID=313612 RepID=UPI0000EAD0A0|nr:O-antigen ligase [Lyngbya sp. PCC 8106]EAW38326.1 O-antigen polymerase [Lyngbya sp. PCC 8106]